MWHFIVTNREMINLAAQVVTLVVVAAYTTITYRLLSAQIHQGFENKFLQLLRFHHDIVNAVRVPPPPGGAASHPSHAVLGRPAFEVLYNELIRLYTATRQEHPEARASQLADEAYGERCVKRILRRDG